MPSEIQNKLGCFTADFRDGYVTVGGETFPSGFFFVNAMNEYHKPYSGDDSEDFEIAQKLLIMHTSGRAMRDELVLGLFNPRHAEKLYDEILYKINAISRTKPFCYLDLDGERERCRRLFSDETANKIIEHLRKRALFYNEDQTGWTNHPLPRQSDINEFREGEALLQNYIKTISFYEELGYGIDNAYQIGKAFVVALESSIKRSEGNLMAMAQQCIAEHHPRGFTVFERDMRVIMEYVSIQKNKNASVISRRMTFERFGDFLLADFFEGLHVGHYPLRCGVCKRYFLQTTARHRKYCDGYAPDDTKGRSCVAFAARSKRLLAKEMSARAARSMRFITHGAGR